MINAIHLLWIAPLAASFGFVLCAVLAVGKGGDTGYKENTEHHEEPENKEV